MSDLYMGGSGVQKHTRKLNDEMFEAMDKMWDTLILCHIGSCAAVLGPLISYAFWIDHFPWEPQPTGVHHFLAIVVSVICVTGGVWAAAPWFKARHEVRARTKIVKAHTARMKAETAKRGDGWARS